MNEVKTTRFDDKSGRPNGAEVFGLQTPIFDERGPIDDECRFGSTGLSFGSPKKENSL